MLTRTIQREETAALLRNSPFRRLWAAQFSAVTAVYGLTLASAVLVEERTHSTTQTGIVILSAVLPAFLASLVSGAVVDRWGRKRVLMVSHLARAVVALGFWAGAQLLPFRLALSTVVAINVTGAMFTQFSLPAELALLPELVARSRLLSANALLQLSMLSAEGLGIIFLSPLVIKLAGTPAVGLVSAGLCLFALVVVATLPKDHPAAEDRGDTGSVWVNLGMDLQAGWRAITRDRLLSLVVVQATLAAALLMVLLSLVPGLVSHHWGFGVEDAPLLMLPGGLGFVLGAVLMSRFEERLSRPALIAAGLTGLGLSIGLLGVLSGTAGRLWLVVPPISGLGLTLALVIIPARTILQERPPPSMRGRVIAAQLALANAVAVLPLLLGSALADHLGIRPVIGLLSLLAVGAGAIGLRQALS